MKFYFSGVKSTTELSWLKAARISRILVDPFDFKHILKLTHPLPFALSLDSGGYRVWKQGGQINLDQYLQLAISYPFTWVASPDQIGDAQTSYQNWLYAKQWLADHTSHPPLLIPVWHWATSSYSLERYLDQNWYVGIGALVPFMRRGRSKSPSERRQALEQVLILQALCQDYPQRFHLFGCCWLEALDRLKHTAWGADSSHWLAGAKYGWVIHTSKRTGKLTYTHYRNLNFASSRRDRCIACAANLETHLNQQQ